jgi:hypothetical protein
MSTPCLEGQRAGLCSPSHSLMSVSISFLCWVPTSAYGMFNYLLLCLLKWYGTGVNNLDFFYRSQLYCHRKMTFLVFPCRISLGILVLPILVSCYVIDPPNYCQHFRKVVLGACYVALYDFAVHVVLKTPF